jgi:hypothetical protein
MSIIPDRESDDKHYCRLFRPWPERPTLKTPKYGMFVEGLKALVEEMRDNGVAVCEDKPEELIEAGYTYFGQFLDHEVTKDRTPLDDAWTLKPHQIENLQTPRLDLSHLYGGGPGDSKDGILYQGDRLKIGDKVPSVLYGIDRSFDVGFENGSLLIGDDRARENVILRQLTAVFARLHNLAVNQCHSFDRARQQTIWQFQRLVVEDYLNEVLDRAVYKSVFIDRQTLIEWDHFSIPVEFSVAAFRFGHSMVLDSYSLSEPIDKTLSELMERALWQKPLQSEWEIDWGMFFQGASSTGPVITARPIDTRISSGLFKVPIQTALLFSAGVSRLFVTDETIRLPLVSLMRGSGLALASGQYAAARFGEPVLTEDELTNDCNGKITRQGEVLKEYRMTRETPLFYYVLKESEVRNNGNKLGPTGSHIIAETIYAALKHDPTSYLNDPAGADPPTWEFPSGKDTLTSLADLFEKSVEF